MRLELAAVVVIFGISIAGSTAARAEDEDGDLAPVAVPPAPATQSAPAPAAEAPPAAPPVAAPPHQGPRFGLFLGGLAVPGPVYALAGGATYVFHQKQHGQETRVYGVAYHVEDAHTKTTGAVAILHDTLWFGGAYGVGGGAGVGFADFARKTGGGWHDSTLQIVAYISPVMLRLGSRHQVEIGVNIGPTRFLSHDVRPFGYLFVGWML